jgi:hypothetical protein
VSSGATEIGFYFDSYNLKYKIVAVQGFKVALTLYH